MSIDESAHRKRLHTHGRYQLDDIRHMPGKPGVSDSHRLPRAQRRQRGQSGDPQQGAGRCWTPAITTPARWRRGLATRQTRRVAVMTLDIRDVHHAAIAYEIERAMASRRVQHRPVQPGRRPPPAPAKMLRTLSAQQIDRRVLRRLQYSCHARCTARCIARYVHRYSDSACQRGTAAAQRLRRPCRWKPAPTARPPSGWLPRRAARHCLCQWMARPRSEAQQAGRLPPAPSGTVRFDGRAVYRAERSVEGGRLVTTEHILLEAPDTRRRICFHRGYHRRGLACTPCRSAGVARSPDEVGRHWLQQQRLLHHLLARS